MGDETQWQAPGGGANSAPAPTSGVTPAPPVQSVPSVPLPPPPPGFTAAPPVYAAPPAYAAPPLYAAPHIYAAPGAYAPPGWTPPPKPGLIPLRPLDLGTLLGAAFRVMRRNPRPTLGAALAIQGTSVLLLAVVFGFVTYKATGRIASSTDANSGLITAGAFASIGLASLVPGVLVIVASALLQAVIVFEVSRAALGEKPKFRQHWQHAKGRWLALIGWSFLLTAALVIGIVGVVVVIVVATVIGSTTKLLAVGILLGIFASLAIFAVLAWLAAKTSFVSSIIMAERATVGQAIARSWSLTAKSFWRVFGILLLVAAILGSVTEIAVLPVSFIAPLFLMLIDPNGSGNNSTETLSVVFVVLTVIIRGLISTITSVIQASAVTLLYLDLRMRREGLDLTLARYVENRHNPAASQTDPYLLPPNSAAGPATEPPTW